MRLELEPRTAAFPLVENEVHEDAYTSASWDFDSLLKKGVAAAQSGDRDGARKLLSQATAVNPASEDAWMWLASISEYPEELLAFLNRVLEINPANDKAVEWRRATTSLLAKTFVQRALAARNDGSFDLAGQYLEQALINDSECESAWFWKASMAMTDDQKLELYGRVLTINPENHDAAEAVEKIGLAQVAASLDDAKAYAANGDRHAARSILENLVNNDSAEIREAAWLTMCETADSNDQKLQFLNQVLAVNPGNRFAAVEIEGIERTKSMAAFDEAKTAAASGDRKKAVKILDRFVKEVPDSVDAWLLKSHLSESLDEKVEALEKALEIDPENTAARSGLEFLSLTFGSNNGQIMEQSDAEPVVPLSMDSNFQDGENFLDVSVQESQPASEFDEAVEFASRATEESFQVENQETEFPTTFSQEALSDTSRPADDIFGTMTEEADPTRETVDSLSPFADEVMNQDPFAAEVPVFGDTELDPAQYGTACPFCATFNEPQALECSSCDATLTLADIEKLLTGTSANTEMVQHAVTAMEADWNTREFSEAEFIALSIGHFNLGNTDNGFRYLQEASRVSPNNVILSSHVNTIAIRLGEMRNQHESYDAMPKGKTILVVDDSPTVRKLISGKLEKSGHNVVCAVDGIDALAKLEQGMPDLVLLDITMPRMDGYEVCKQIRANPAGKDLPVVMISGKDGFFDKVRGRMAGTSGYVTKPFGPETLMKALETYLLPDQVEVS